MSASLVGSEMCIRDRPMSELARQCSEQGDLPARRCPEKDHLPALGCEAAVSYTHLTLPTICSV
eukprot:10369483-Alexandrium_andersonii.AAC.1